MIKERVGNAKVNIRIEVVMEDVAPLLHLEEGPRRHAVVDPEVGHVVNEVPTRESNQPGNPTCDAEDSRRAENRTGMR